MKDGYREAASVPVEPPGTDTLTRHLIDANRHRWVGRAFLKGWVTVVLGAIASGAGPGWGLLVFALGVVWTGAGVRQRRSPGVVFRVRHRHLIVSRPGATDIEVSLDRLHDVRLDTKASSRDLTLSRSDGVNAAFGMSSGHSIEFDVSRIELVTASGGTIVLSPEYLSHSLSIEELGAIRRFLRTQGWVPVDERQA